MEDPVGLLPCCNPLFEEGSDDMVSAPLAVTTHTPPLSTAHTFRHSQALPGVVRMLTLIVRVMPRAAFPKWWLIGIIMLVTHDERHLVAGAQMAGRGGEREEG